MANSLNKITTKSILDATVATADIADDAVTGAKIADDAIDSEHYTDGSIDTAHIADNQVTGDKLADDITLAGTLTIPDTINHTGDTNTKIRFIDAGDTITAETDGTERIRIDGTGRVGIGQTSFATSDTMLSVSEISGHCEVGIISKNDSAALINLGDTDSYNQGRIKYDNSAGQLEFRAAGTDCVRMQADNMTIVDGNLIIGTAGHGIDFSANSHASGMSSELLDSYEEGSFTPFVGATTTDPSGITYQHQDGRYTKVGNIVHIQIFIDIDAGDFATNGVGDGVIAGLPFSSASTANRCVGGFYDAFKQVPNNFSSGRNNAMLSMVWNTSNISIHQFDADNPTLQTGWSITQIDNGDKFKWRFWGSYRV